MTDEELFARVDCTAEEMRDRFAVPGLALALWRGGRRHVAGFGVRELGRDDPVDGDTVFNVGSTTKAFTATSVALLVADGRVRWDDRLVDHMPWFRLSDPAVTERATIRDLLGNRLGVAGDPYLRANASCRRDFVERLRHLPFARPFRQGFHYFNDGFVAAGQLVEEVTGERWEDFVRARLLAPLGMHASGAGIDTYRRASNRTGVHSRADVAGRLEAIDPEWYGATKGLQEPAGGMFLTMNDAAAWLEFNLRRGIVGATRVLAPAAFDDLFGPVALDAAKSYHEASYGRRDPAFSMGESFYGYALGWGVADFRGRTVLSHEGMNPGVRAVTALIPSLDAGFFAVLNAETGATDALLYALVDALSGLPEQGWPARFEAASKAERAAKAEHKRQLAQARQQDVGPTLPLSHYAGDYHDDGLYGPASIALDDAATALVLRFGMFTYRLEPWLGERFAAISQDRWMTPAYSDYDSFLRFELDAAGRVTALVLETQSAVRLRRAGA